jgi:hypothetical protein
LKTATLTVRFLQDQANKLQTQISDIEGQLTSLKARNGAALASNGAPPLIDTGSFSAQITSLQSENRQLIAQSRKPAGNDAIAAAEAALASAQAQYSDTHPDVIAAKERLSQLRRNAQQNSEGGNVLQEQIAANNAAIHQLMEQRDSTLSRANAAMAGQARAPAIMEQAMQLENRVTTLRNQFQQVSENSLKAQNSSRMATEQRAERLSLSSRLIFRIALTRPIASSHWRRSCCRPWARAASGINSGARDETHKKPASVERLGLPILGVVPMLKPNTSASSAPCCPVLAGEAICIARSMRSRIWEGVRQVKIGPVFPSRSQALEFPEAAARGAGLCTDSIAETQVREASI